MLLRHGFYYLLARGLPGLVNFAALAVYTRLLTPDEFGKYALVIAAVGLAEALLFMWLRLVLGRFLPAQDEPARFLGGIAALFLVLAVFVTGLGAMLLLVWRDPIWQKLLALAIPLLLAQAWLEFTQTIAKARLEPGRFGLLLGSKTVSALVIGGLFAWIGLGAQAPLIGLLVGHAIAIGIFGAVLWRGATPRWPETAALRQQLGYGLPLVVAFALSWIIQSSDRFLISWLLDDAAVGVYSVGYDLAQHSLGMLLAVVNAAAFPLAVNALEKSGIEAAREQVLQNGTLIASVALGGSAGMMVLTPEIVELMIGHSFREGAVIVMPWIAAAAAIGGIKSFHFDLAFHLGAKSRFLVLTTLIAAFTNIVLNLALIPFMGIVGAACATVAALVVAAGSSALLAERAFPMPGLRPVFIPGILVGFASALGALVGRYVFEGPAPALGAGILLGTLGATIVALATNVADLRHIAWRRLTST